MAKKAAPRVVETIGQFQDAVLKDRADTVRVSGGSQFAHFGGLIQRCYDHYGAYPRDGALLRAIGAVARHRGCHPYLVRRMTLEEFNAALDEVFTPPTPPADAPADPPADLQDAPKDLIGLGCKPRDEWFLARYEEADSATFHKPAVILTKWSNMATAERTAICPDAPHKHLTVDAVRKAIQRARNRAKTANG
jgi:hypothetical protein